MSKTRLKYLLITGLCAIMYRGLAKADFHFTLDDPAATPGFTLKNPIRANSFAEVVQGFARILVTIGIPLAGIFLIWSGFLFVSARGNAQQLEKAKTTFWYTIIGTAIIVGAYAIATAVVNFAKEL